MSPSPSAGERKPESKEEAEALIPLFAFERVLNQDQNGRRITLLGSINSLPALLTLERAAFPSDTVVVRNFLSHISNTTNLGANDVYRWYMACRIPDPLSSPESSNQTSSSAPDLKLNLIYPCTPQHVKKYTSQRLRYVTESAQTYATHVKPWVVRTQRTPARLDWIYNILDGITEQEDVIYRTSDDFDAHFPATVGSPNKSIPNTDAKSHQRKSGFILLPDLNWDRKTITGLHLLALVQRRDLWSLRGLKKSDVEWLQAVRNLAVKETVRYARSLNQDSQDPTDEIDEDMFKCYIHYQPTYYHFHIHIVHVMLEAEGTTQSVGKAFALENLISQLQHLSPPLVSPSSTDEEANIIDRDAGLDQIDLSYFVGEESDLWKKCFAKIKRGDKVDLNQ